MQTGELTRVESSTAISFKQILLATDLSGVSQTALAYACAIARVHSSKLSVVNVLTPQPHAFIAMEPMPVVEQDEREQARLALHKFVSAVSLLDGLEHEEIVVRGQIWAALDALIHERKVDLLVLGTHGRGGLRKLVLGSVAEELFRLVECPVLTIGPEVRTEGANRPLKTILFATDFKPASLKALPYAIHIASESNAKLILLHLLPIKVGVGIGPYWIPDGMVSDVEDDARVNAVEELKRLMPVNAGLAQAPEFLVSYDFLPDGILKYDVDLIVMGVNHAASPRTAAHLPWVAAHEVIGNARCPVLTVCG
jgi:nucleotide-binding universal stress UspA family protein